MAQGERHIGTRDHSCYEMMRGGVRDDGRVTHMELEY